MPFRFESPSYRVARPGDRFWIRLLDTVHLTVLRKDGAYLTVEEPTDEQVSDADAVWLGGYENIVSDEEAANLTAAGYGAFLSIYVPPVVAPPPAPEPPPGDGGGGTDPGTGGGGTTPPDTPPPAPTDPPEYGAGSYGAGIYGS